MRRGRHAARAPTDPTPPPSFVTVWAAAVTVVLGLLFAGTTALTIALWANDLAHANQPGDPTSRSSRSAES